MRQLFIPNAGRSGSFLLHKLLSLYPHVESHHEFCCPHVQQLGVLSYLGLMSEYQVASNLKEIYGNGMLYSEAEIFSDSSNKTSWLLPHLYRLFPDARFIYQIRDGRKCVSSYANKLSEECYNDRDVNTLYRWLDQQPDSKMDYPANWYWWRSIPPPTKMTWWVLPRPTDPVAPDFRYKWNRWQRLCWYWQEVNRVILESLEQIPFDQWVTVALEDLTQDRDILRGLLDFMELDYTEEAYQLVGRPTNVHEPVNYPITDEQEAQYWEICGEMHDNLGYERGRVYDVQY